MHDLNKSLDELARGIDRAERKISSDNTAFPQMAATVDYERLARERAERELYAARYKEQLLKDVEPAIDAVPEGCLEAAEPDLSECEKISGDTQPRVTENAPDMLPKNAESARILTIPGAVYRIPTARSEYSYNTPTPVATASGSYDVGGIDEAKYRESATDESADAFFSSMLLPQHEIQSKISQPTIVDTAEAEIHSIEADYEAISKADDAGAYDAPVEYSDPEPVSDEQHPIAVSYDPAHEAEEYERFLKEHEQKRTHSRKHRRVASEKDIDTIYFPVDSVEKSVKLVEARMLYEIEMLKVEHRMLGYTFSMDVLKKGRTDRKMRRQISDRMYMLSRALKRERADVKRYYTAALDKYIGNPNKRDKNTVAIESVLTRLDYALKERERIDESLMRLYGEGTPSADTAKENKVVEKAARAAYRTQLKAAKRVAKMHAPDELKEKIFELMNERVKLLSDIERNAYLLSRKRYTGADKRAVKRKNRALKRTVRQREEDIRFFIKKAEKHSESHGAGMHQVAWLVALVLLVAVGGVLYLLAKYYWRLF